MSPAYQRLQRVVLRRVVDDPRTARAPGDAIVAAVFRSPTADGVRYGFAFSLGRGPRQDATVVYTSSERFGTEGEARPAMLAAFKRFDPWIKA